MAHQILKEVADVLGSELYDDTAAENAEVELYRPDVAATGAISHHHLGPPHISSVREGREATETSLGDVNDHEQISEAALAVRSLQIRLLALEENFAVSRIVRELEIEQLDAAVGVLERELRWRQQQCCSLRVEMRRLAQRKIDILAAAIRRAKDSEGGPADTADGGSESSHSAPVALQPRNSALKERKSPVRGSVNQLWSASNSAASAAAKRNTEKLVACGPLTQASAKKFAAVAASTSASS